jgi:RNA-directed DNA polymerase
MADRVVVLIIRVQQNARGGKDPDREVCRSVKGGRSEMIKALSSLQDLRRRIYHKAKSDPTPRVWGLFVHVAKLDTLTEAYQQAQRNGGAPGLDGRTFAAIAAEGLEQFLTAIRDEL